MVVGKEKVAAEEMAVSSGGDNGGVVIVEGVATSGGIEVAEGPTDVDAEVEGVTEGTVFASGITGEVEVAERFPVEEKVTEGGEMVVAFATASSVSSLNGDIFINYEILRNK